MWVESHLDRIKSKVNAYEKLLLDLKKKREQFKIDIITQGNTTKISLQNEIKSSFNQIRGKVQSFADRNYKNDSELITQKWNNEVSSMRLQENIKAAFVQASKRYNKKVSEILEELGRDLQLVAQLSGGSFDVKNTYNGFSLKIGGQILAVAGILISLAFPPLGIVITGIGAVLGWLGGFFKSDEDKRREAVKKIEKALKSQIDLQESQIIEQANENLHKQCQNISSTGRQK